YPVAGAAHMLIFLGFNVLLLRSIILWGRGFSPGFQLGIFGETPVHVPGIGLLSIGPLYGFLKDIFASLVLLGSAVFVYYRVIRPQRRMSLHPEGLVILGIIMTMMIADMTYDGASLVLHHRFASFGCDGASGDLADLCGDARIIL